MAENFFLDESAFEGLTDDMLATGKGFTKEQKTLSDILLAHQGCWGDDEIGKAFQENYWENAEKVREGTAEGGEGIVETSKNAWKSAEDLSSVDEETAKWLDSQIETE